MRIQYLGTAAAEGWPAPFCHCLRCEGARKMKGRNYRSRPQVLINDDLLMDYGPDTFYHSHVYDIDMDKVKTVLLTHSHSDHFHPLDLILRVPPYAFGQNQEIMQLFGNESCEKMFEDVASGPEAPENFSQYVQFNRAEAFVPFSHRGYEVLPLKAVHVPDEKCLLYAVRCPDGKRFFYGNDTGSVCEETWNAVKNWRFDLVSLDCTMGTGSSCYSHLCLADDSAIRRKMIESGLADEETVFVVTHFSHGCAPLHDELSALASAEGFLTAYDGMTLEI